MPTANPFAQSIQKFGQGPFDTGAPFVGKTNMLGRPGGPQGSTLEAVPGPMQRAFDRRLLQEILQMPEPEARGLAQSLLLREGVSLREAIDFAQRQPLKELQELIFKSFVVMAPASGI